MPQNIALNYFRYGYGETKMDHWAENPYPAQAELERRARSSPATVSPVMYPYFTKSESRTDYVQEFSSAEIERVLGYDIKRLNSSREKLNELKNYKPETDVRAKIRDRFMERLEASINELTQEINNKLNAIVENTNPSNSGIQTQKEITLKKLQMQSGV
jgi:hypothetical protein